MPQIKQILEEEKARSSDTRALIRLYQEGTFYRAYEWSAWLCSRLYRSLKVTHKRLKSIEDSVCFIGFPMSSIVKYTPDGADVEVRDDKTLCIYLPMDEIPDDMTYEMMQTDYASWKQSLPLEESKQKRNADNDATKSAPYEHVQKKQMDMNEIMRHILAFPVEDRTPIQCMQFLANMRQQIAGLL